MLTDKAVVAFVATAKADRAKAFYTEQLGLRLIEDSPFAIVVDAGGTMLRIQRVKEVALGGYTALGWDVPDIRGTIRELTGRGIEFMRVNSLPQDDLGVWTTPDGSLVAWFKDPDGNTLSLTQFA